MKSLFIALFITAHFSISAQVQVVLDNWYNHEIKKETGLSYHYLWSDSAFSGFSRLGSVFTTSGAQTSTLVQAPTPLNLAEADIYIIVDPDTISENPNPNYILEKEITAIKKWVKRGGVLLLMANDGPNCEFTHFNKLAEQFGFRFNAVTINPVKGKNWEMGAESDLPDHPLFKGVSKIYMKEAASIQISGHARKVLADQNNILIAECNYGNGFVLAVGDPWLYNEYIDHDLLPEDFDNHKAAKNLVEYLIDKTRR